MPTERVFRYSASLEGPGDDLVGSAWVVLDNVSHMNRGKLPKLLADRIKDRKITSVNFESESVEGQTDENFYSDDTITLQLDNGDCIRVHAGKYDTDVPKECDTNTYNKKKSIVHGLLGATLKEIRIVKKDGIKTRFGVECSMVGTKEEKYKKYVELVNYDGDDSYLFYESEKFNFKDWGITVEYVETIK